MKDLKEVSEMLKKEGESGELFVDSGVPTFFVKKRYDWMSKYESGWDFVQFRRLWFSYLEKDHV